MKAPIAFVLFNRPDTTGRVFAEIRAAQPRELFLIADGPRANVPGDIERCAAARKIVEDVDWECEVRRNFSDINLGCGQRPATGIDWVFENVDRAIILEDDCVPHLTFFRFCDELLERYAEDERVMHVAGNNFQLGQRRGSYSYYFSRHNICAGGWATWRRAWRHFDPEITKWENLRSTPWLLDILAERRHVDHWMKIFDQAHRDGKSADYWDYQWTFSFWTQSGLAAVPNVELLTNIGFSKDATHTRHAKDKWANVATAPMEFPLRHPPHMIPDGAADRFFLEQTSLNPPPKRRNKLDRVLGRLLGSPVAHSSQQRYDQQN
ncbi:MAG TPA: glycosyltransferase family 2 protein [Verrucomicrobiae bacterium]|nr:glycosyltransferase family 2 protein [Verrucomicrobiae bacterium]